VGAIQHHVRPTDTRRRRGAATKTAERLAESDAPADASREELRKLTLRLESAREQERAQVARELHDELGQVLTSLKLEVNGLIERLVSVDPKPDVAVVNRLQSILGLTEMGIQTVRRLATDLRPAALDHLGLPEAIEGELITFNARTRIRYRFVNRGGDPEIDVERRTAVFRILQEALTNVARHSNAGAITVTLSQTRQGVSLRIRDNGRGIRTDQLVSRRSIGILGMRERAASLGGTVEIVAAEGRGTTVVVRMPVRQRRDHVVGNRRPPLPKR
jgi:signal transduction histidine kinase